MPGKSLSRESIPTLEEMDQIYAASDTDLISIITKSSIRDRLLEIAVNAAVNRNLHRALPSLIKLLNNPSTAVQIKSIAIWAIAKIGNKEALDLIIRTYKKTRSYDLKWAALGALGTIKDDKSIELLIDALNKTDGEPLRTTIHSLGSFQEKKAIEPLIKLFESIISSDAINNNNDIGENAWLNLWAISSAFGSLNDPRFCGLLARGLRLGIMGQHHRCGLFVKTTIDTMETLGCLENPETSVLLSNLLREAKELWQAGLLIPHLEKIGNQTAIDGLWHASKRFEEAAMAISRLKFERDLPICDRCGQLRDLQPIDEETGQYLEICLKCWTEMVPLQDNPDTRTVGSCGWNIKDKRAGARSSKTKSDLSPIHKKTVGGS